MIGLSDADIKAIWTNSIIVRAMMCPAVDLELSMSSEPHQT